MLRSSTLFGATPATTAVPEAQRESIEGVWAMKRFAVSRYIGALTDEGERLRAAFDPIKDDPAIYCDPASPVRFWVNVNEPFEIKREATPSSSTISSWTPAVYPLERDGAAAGHAAQHDGLLDGPLRRRRARHRDDELRRRDARAALRRHAFGGSEAHGAPRGQRQTHELEITWTIDDPVVFKEPHTQKEIYVRTERWREPYNCKPGYQQ